MRLFPIYILLTICCISCFPVDKAVAPYDRTGLITGVIDITPTYSQQAFYNLQTNSIVRQEDFSFWDLSFDCTSDSLGVYLNSAQLMGVYKVESSSFETVSNDTTFFANKWKYDSPSGYIDSSAIGKWWGSVSNNQVITKGEYFVTTLGVDSKGNSLGVKKFTLLNADLTQYKIRFANLNGTEDTIMTIQKDSMYNVVGLSLLNKQVVYPEPPKNDWDLLLSRYTQLFIIFEEFPYPVTGVLINKSKIKALLDTIVDFRTISRTSFSEMSFTNRKDVIGYDWKTFDFTASAFLVLPNKTYVIKTNSNQYYKLFFSDFYDSKTGSKGVIQFQYETIQ